jgi:hypothetical protein
MKIMSHTNTRGMGTIMRGLLAASLLVAGAGLAASPMMLTASAYAGARAELFKAGDKVKVTLKDGTVLEGEVVEHTQAQMRIRIKKDIGTSTRTLESSEIASVALAGGDSTPETPAAPSGLAGPGGTTPTLGGAASGSGSAGTTKSPFASGSSMDPIGSETTTMYVIPLRGEVGRDVSFESMRRTLEDAIKMNPDVLVFDINMDLISRGQKIEDQELFEPSVYNELMTVRTMSMMFTDEIRDNPKWKTRSGTKPRLVMWVRRALGSAAFIPWVSPDIFYASNALHGGIGHIELVANMPSKRVREKMIGIRMATAEGLAIKGGHDPRVIRAMARTDYELSVDYVGGKPVFREDLLGQEILTDAGGIYEDRTDTFERIVRFEGNDWLTLTGDRALKLGVGRGKADSLEELAFELGVARDYRVFHMSAAEVMGGWTREVLKAEQDLRTKMREFRRAPVDGETASERNRQRGRIIGMLRDIARTLDRFGDSINARYVGFNPPQFRQELEVLIEQLNQQIRSDR